MLRIEGLSEGQASWRVEASLCQGPPRPLLFTCRGQRTSEGPDNSQCKYLHFLKTNHTRTSPRLFLTKPQIPAQIETLRQFVFLMFSHDMSSTSGPTTFLCRANEAFLGFGVHAGFFANIQLCHQSVKTVISNVKEQLRLRSNKTPFTETGHRWDPANRTSSADLRPTSFLISSALNP